MPNTTLEQQLADERGWRFKGRAVQYADSPETYEVEALGPAGVGRHGKGVGATREQAVERAVLAAIIDGENLAAESDSDHAHELRTAVVWLGWKVSEARVPQEVTRPMVGWEVRLTPPGWGDRFAGCAAPTAAAAFRGAVRAAVESAAV